MQARFSMLARVGLLSPTTFGSQLYKTQPFLKAPRFNPVLPAKLLRTADCHGILVHVPPEEGYFTGGCPSAQTHPLGWAVFNETPYARMHAFSICLLSHDLFLSSTRKLLCHFPSLSIDRVLRVTWQQYLYILQLT